MQNPLESYRRTQRELRRQFETFTRANCPTCPTPCCRRPARIAPTDILLAEATGWRANLPDLETTKKQNTNVTENDPGTEPQTDMVAATAERYMIELSASDSSEAKNPADDLPCEYLGATGCTFPTDLRPFGCTTYICKYMYARLDRPTLTRIKRLVRELDDKHTILLRTVSKQKNEE